MRITLDIENDVLKAARVRARLEKKTVGEVISELARAALSASASMHATTKSTRREPAAIYGFRPFPKRGGIITSELVYAITEDVAY
jgi:hypothetical protein